MTPQEIEAKITRLEDIHEIENLKGRYNHFLLMGAFDAIVDLFAKKDPNVKVEISKNGVFEGIEGVRRVFLKGMKSLYGGEGCLALHMSMTPVIEVSQDGKTAKGMWLSFGCNTIRDENGLVALWQTGKYDNEFVKEDGKWKFRSMHWYLIFRTSFDKGWVKEPVMGRSRVSEGTKPDKPSTYHMPYNPKAINSFLPVPPEPVK